MYFLMKVMITALLVLSSFQKCRDAAWQPIADLLTTPADQKCLCNVANLTRTSHIPERFYDLSVGGEQSVTLYPPYYSGNGNTPTWNTDCVLEFELATVGAIADSSIEASVSCPASNVVNNPTTVSIPPKSQVSFTYQAPSTISSNSERAFTVNYNINSASLSWTTSTRYEIRFHMRVHNVHSFDEFGVDTVSQWA